MSRKKQQRVSRKKQRNPAKGGNKKPTHRPQPQPQPEPTASSPPPQPKAQADEAPSLNWRLGTLSHETTMAMAVILLSFVLTRIGVMVVAMLGADAGFLRMIGLEPGDFMALRFGSGLDLFTALCAWDCELYAMVWSEGYDGQTSTQGLPSWARTAGLFPLFPMSIGVISYLLPLSPLAVAHIFNGACLLAAAWILYLMVRDHQGHRAALIAATLFLTTPYSLFSTVPYTEALFNLLSIAAFYMAYQKRWIASGLCLALVSATRPAGLLVALGILVIAIREVGLGQLLRVRDHARIALAFALCPLGIGLFALYLYFLHGDALAFLNVHTAWSSGADGGLPIPFVKILSGLFDAGGQNPWIAGYNAIIAVFALTVAVFLARVGFLPEAVFLGALVLVSTSIAVTFIPRYALAIWPAYLFLGILLKNRPIIPLVLPFLLAFGLMLSVLGWVNWTPWNG